MEPGNEIALVQEYVGCFTYDKIRDLFRVVGNYTKYICAHIMIFVDS